LIVRSSTLRHKERQELIGAVRKLLARLQQIAGYLNRNRYFRADYAREQVHKALAKSDAGRFVRCDLRGESGALTLDWQLDYSALIDHCRRLGRYVLFTDRSPKEYDSSALLRAYKSQHQVEANFRQLKNELHLAPIFLKNENRILAIAAFYIITLMVIAILQFVARKAGLETSRGRAITARELLITYGAWMAVAVSINGRRYLIPNPPTAKQREYLQKLDFPPPEHWIPKRWQLPEHLRIPGT
jgi:transposase